MTAAPKAARRVPAPRRSAAPPVKKAAAAASPAAERVISPRISPPQMSPPQIEDAQSRVVASKFAGVEAAQSKPPVRRTLPASYGESRLLLLARDPQTLFAAWDMAPSTVESLQARLGRRGFAVSTLTLRLTRAGGGATVMHVGKRARSRYLKIDPGPFFIAEIGFTTPVGRFEFVARSAPCFVPMGPLARQASIETGHRAVLGYREAMAVARRGGLAPNPRPVAGVTRALPNPSTDGAASPALTLAPRVVGGASDLYRR